MRFSANVELSAFSQCKQICAYPANQWLIGTFCPDFSHAARTPWRTCKIMKSNDPTIDRIRDVRHRISESVGHDPKKLVEYYRLLQERHRDRLIGERDEQSLKINGDVIPAETQGLNAATR